MKRSELSKTRLLLDKRIMNYTTTYKQGFLRNEIEEFLKKFYPEYTPEQFFNNFGCNTCMVIDGQSVFYQIDIYHCLLTLLENRELKGYEWD